MRARVVCIIWVAARQDTGRRSGGDVGCRPRAVPLTRTTTPLAKAFVAALATEVPGRRSSADEDKRQDHLKMAVIRDVTPSKGLADALRVRQHKSTRQLSGAHPRIHDEDPFMLLRAAWRRPSAATRRPTHGATCGPRGATHGATCGPRGATRGPCDPACGAAYGPCGPSPGATHGPCDPAGSAPCNSSARACGFSHFVTAAGHVDLPSLKFRTLVYSTAELIYPPLTIIGVWLGRRPTASHAGRGRALRHCRPVSPRSRSGRTTTGKPWQC